MHQPIHKSRPYCVKISQIMNFRSKKWTILLLVFLIIFSLGVFIQFSLNSFSQNPFSRQSGVNISLVDLKLKLDFDITKEERPQFNAFIRNWFGETDEINNISFAVDENLEEFLKASLPVKLILDTDGKTLNFKSKSVVPLQNPLVKNDFEFATGSGKLSVKYTDPSKYQLSIENPADLVFYATSSGTLTISQKIERLFQTLPKLATIELNVSGKNIAGKIVLN